VENKQTLYVIGGVGVVVVILLLLRKGSSGPTVITSPATDSSTANPDQARLSELALNADLVKNLAGLVYTQKAADAQSQVGLAQVEAGRQVGLAQTQAASSVAAAQIAGQSQITAAQLASQSQLAGLQAQLQSAAIAAARDVGLAQSQSDLTRQQMQNDALQQQLDAQNRNALTQGLLSNIGNILRAIGLGQQQQQQQQQPKAASGGGVSAGGGSAPGSSTAGKVATKLNPRLPQPGLPSSLFPPALWFGPDTSLAANTAAIDAAAPNIPSLIPAGGGGVGVPFVPDFSGWISDVPLVGDILGPGIFDSGGSTVNVVDPATGESLGWADPGSAGYDPGSYDPGSYGPGFYDPGAGF
jgi:hypothetical protein